MTVSQSEIPGVTRAPTTPVEAAVRPSSWGRRLALFSRNKINLVAAVFLIFEVVVAVFAPLIAPDNPNTQDLLHRLQGASSAHWLGTDQYGRDALSRLIYGARVSLEGAAIAVAVGVTLGVSLGLVAGYLGKLTDAILSRGMDVVLSIPGLLLAITVVGVLGTGLVPAMIAIGVASIPFFYRITRGQTQVVSAETFVEASRMIGCRPRRVIWRHVFPNTLSPIVVQVALAFGGAVTAEASLSFIGLGVQPPTASWGSMLQDATQSLRTTPVLAIAPGVVIALTVLAFTLVGNGLRAALGSGRQSVVGS
jgi:peptide/nickel transport system permease protein